MLTDSIAPFDGPKEEKGADPLFEGNTASTDPADCFSSIGYQRVPVHSLLLNGHTVAASSARYERRALGNISFIGSRGLSNPSPVAIEP